MSTVHNFETDYYQQLLDEEFILNLAKRYSPEDIFSKKVLSAWAIANGFKKVKEEKQINKFEEIAIASTALHL